MAGVTHSTLIVLGERETKTGVDGTKDNGVGDHLNKMGLTGREGEKHSGREEDEKNHGNKNVGVEHLYVRT